MSLHNEFKIIIIIIKLYGGHLIRAVNAWAVSVVRYSAGVLEWSDRELREMDVRTRKLLTMFGVFHIRGCIGRGRTVGEV